MPQASMKYPTKIVNANKNAGYHRQGKRAYRRAVTMIRASLTHYREPRLHHLCFQGSTNTAHKRLLQCLVQKLDRKGLPCEWFSAREVDSDKGEHLHVFMLLDSAAVRTQSVLNSFEDQFLGRECEKRGILLHINKPRNLQLHGMNRYAALPYLGPNNRATTQGMARLEDALLWLTYIYKARGKPDADDKKANGQIFSSSRPNRKQFNEDQANTLPWPALPHAIVDDGDDIADLAAASHLAYAAIQQAAALHATH
jgi:hypothetical protein